jgi:hypothetical protein
MTTNNIYPATGPTSCGITIPVIDKNIGIPNSDLHFYLRISGSATVCVINPLSNAFPGLKFASFGRIFSVPTGTGFVKKMNVAGNLRTLYGDIAQFFIVNCGLWINPSTSLSYTSIYTTQMIRGTNKWLLTTPNIKQAAINHYGCSTLLGIQ